MTMESVDAPQPRISEKQEQARIIRLLKMLGSAVYVLGHPSPADGRTFRGTGQTAGVPDVIAFVPRVGGALAHVYIEAKAIDGRMSPDQVNFKRHCHAAGIEHIHGTLDAVIEWLIAQGICTASQFRTREFGNR